MIDKPFKLLPDARDDTSTSIACIDCKQWMGKPFKILIACVITMCIYHKKNTRHGLMKVGLTTTVLL